MVYESGRRRSPPPFAMAVLTHLLLPLISADVFAGATSRWWWLLVAASLLIIAVTSLQRYRYSHDFITKLVRPKPLHEILHAHYEAAPHEPSSWVKLGREKFLLVRDKDLVAQVLSTDFSAFSKRTQMHDYLLGLFGQDGTEWRRARSSLTPSFTPAALRSAATHVHAHARRLRDVASGGRLAQRHVLAYCVDCIASSVFALSAEALPTPQAPTSSPFLDAVAHIHQVKRSDGGHVLLQLLGRHLFRALSLAELPNSVRSFFSAVGQASFSYRQHNKVSAHDFIKSLMKKMQQEHKTEDQIREEVSEQTVAVLSAGSSDTSHVLFHCLAELAAQPDIQAQLRAHVCAGNDAPPLLDEFIAEVLRLHPAEPVLVRECQTACQVGTEQLQPGDSVIVPVWSLHRDLRPSLVDCDELKQGHHFQLGRKQPVQLQFSAGPRMCVGYRLGLLQVKTALTEVLSHFEIVDSDDDTIHLRKVT